MTRPARLLIVVAIAAVGSVALLGLMARRYGEMLQPTSSASPRVPQSSGLDGFIAVRREIKPLFPSGAEPSAAVDLERLRSSRDRALARYGVDLVDYLELRRVYRDWRAGRGVPTAKLMRDFEQRRIELEQIDLGSFESLDP